MPQLENSLNYVADELSSKHWRKGIGRAAVSAMLEELSSSYSVAKAVAVLKANNFGSQGLLSSLGFTRASEKISSFANPELDEIGMLKALADKHNAV